MRAALLILLLAACEPVSWNTLVAEDQSVRLAMVQSIRIGVTTDTDVATRWGKPTQIVREGGQHQWIYRDMRQPLGVFPQFGDSSEYVIVTFQYGIATGVRTSDFEGCRGTFPPRPPGPGFPNPSTVHPVNCGVTGAVVADGPYGAATVPPAPAGHNPGVPEEGIYDAPGPK